MIKKGTSPCEKSKYPPCPPPLNGSGFVEKENKNIKVSITCLGDS